MREPQMTRRFARSASLVLAFLLVSLRGSSAQTLHNASAPPPPDFRGGLVSPPLPKPRFTLTDTGGAPFDFAAKTQGYITLLFFGYTHCPDMCPLQMQTIAQALKALPPNAAASLKVVFVTTDPDRDTPAVLRAWLDHFDERFIGLTGNHTVIDAAQIAAKLSPATKSGVRPDGAYEVGHAAFVFAYTKDNLAHVIYPVGVTTENLVHDLQLLAQGVQPN
jgi:protein SCO1/2